MINCTEVPILHHSDAAEIFGVQVSILSKKIEKLAKYDGRPFKEIHSPQKRARLALPIFMSLWGGNTFRADDVKKLYLFANSAASTRQLCEQYHALTGLHPISVEDVLGLRVPIRAAFLVSWADRRITLPHTFTLKGVAPKFPELSKLTRGFAYNLSTAQQRAANSFQYRTNWHSPDLVRVSEIWEAAPLCCAVQMSTGSTMAKDMSFSYLSWLDTFSESYPNHLSANEAFLIRKYHNYLHAKSAASRRDQKAAGEEIDHLANVRQHTLTYAAFAAYWGTTFEEDYSLTPKQKQHSRYKHRQRIWFENQITSRKDENAGNPNRTSDSTPPPAAANSEALQADALKVFLSVNSRSRPTQLTWFTPSFYKPYGVENLAPIIKNWGIAARAYLGRHFEEGTMGSSWKGKISAIRFLLDYLCCYIPLWIQQNPESPVRQPLVISDFERVIFWRNFSGHSGTFKELLTEPFANDSIKNNENDDDSKDNFADQPITIRNMYLRVYSKSTCATFIRNINEFFEFIIVEQPGLEKQGMDPLDPWYKNPVNSKYDSPGSGGRGKTDKVTLPVESTLIARGYILALDDIGVRIRDKILSGEISKAQAAEIAKCEWIDLAKYGLDLSLRIASPTNEDQCLQIPLPRIINAFSWKLAYYNTLQKNPILVELPWMSCIRMLAIAMFAGLRLQNAQWLDIDSFDEKHKLLHYTCLNQTTLHVNTDKNGSQRDVTIDLKVMNALLDERRHQLDIYAKPLKWMYYENGRTDKYNYGKIRALFRSPWNKNSSAPFSDTKYSNTWCQILQGIQETYNSFVPAEKRHNFLEQNKSGEVLAVHTPHSLRATWITHMRIYGHLEYELIGLQVAHHRPRNSKYYISVPSGETIAAIRSGELAYMETAYARLTGIAHPPSSPQSAIVKGWETDPIATAKAQNAVSVLSHVLDTEELEPNLIAKTSFNDIEFQKNCICLKNGKCPKMLLEFTMTPRVCGLCPYAVFGIDHLPSIHIKIRELTTEKDICKEKLRALKAQDASSSEVAECNRSLTLASMEREGYIQAAEILTRALQSEAQDPGEYITRFRDLVKFKVLNVDLNNPLQRIAAHLVDSASCPEFTSKHYPVILHRQARTPNVDKLILSDPTDKDVAAGQIISMMKLGDVTFDDIAARMKDTSQVKLHAGI